MHSKQKKPKQGGQKLIVRLLAILLALMFVVSLGSQIFIYAMAEDLGSAGELEAKSKELSQRRTVIQAKLDSLEGEKHSAAKRYELLSELSEVISNQLEVDAQVLKALDAECAWLAQALDEILTAVKDEEVVLECGQEELSQQEADLRRQKADKDAQRFALKQQLEEERAALSETEAAAQAVTEELQSNDEYDCELRSFALQEAGEEEDVLQEETVKRASVAVGDFESEDSQQDAATASGSSVDGRQVVAYALNFVGMPYRWGGESLTDGCDCSGFIKAVYENFGVELPHFSGALQHVGEAVEYEDAQFGDLICYDGHVGIYMGEDKMVNAFDSTHGIIICSVNVSRLVTVRHLI